MPADPVERVEVVILGGGTAGLAALREVRARTESVVIVNDGPWGTTCARVGCMPSKALIASAAAAHLGAVLDDFGVRGGAGLTVDVPAVLARVRKLRDRFVAGVLAATEGLGDRAVSGRGRLLGPSRVAIGERIVEAGRIILATGSRPVVPAAWAPFADRILTSDTLFEQTDLPRRIAVVGMGAIGVEIAQSLSRLGLDIVAFDAAERIAGVTDPVVAETVRALLAAEFPLHLGEAVRLEAAADGVVVAAGSARVEVDAVIAAIGRRPNVDGLGLETLGVPLDDRGQPAVDPETLRIADLPVFLAGDANGDRPLLHEAADEGHIAGLNAMLDAPLALPRRTPLAIVFSDPEVAAVGARFSELDPARTLVGAVDFARLGRALTAGRNRGVMRLYAEPETGRILGSEMAAPAAEHMAHLVALAIGQTLTVRDLLRMPFYHPVYEEGMRTALRDLARQLPPCGLSDLAACPPLGAEALD